MQHEADIRFAGNTHVFAIRPGRTANETKTYTARKPHKKSRAGCAACKVRRVKCDERKPICARCERAATSCQYAGEPAVVQKSNAKLELQRLPPTWSRVPQEARLECHYDRVTGSALDTITFSNILAGPHSPQYRAKVLAEAGQHPDLKHSMLAVAALHLYHTGSKEYRHTGLAHLDAAIPKFNESLNGGLIVRKESPHVLYTAMLMTLHYFCIESKAATDSWVFSSNPDHLAWLVVQRGLAPLFAETQKYHSADSFMTPVFNIIDGHRSASEGLPLDMLLMCGYRPISTEDELRRNPYASALQELNALVPLEHNIPNVLKHMRFLAGLDNTFFALVSKKDPRALLIVSYCFASMCDVSLWWTQPRAIRDCWEICSYLEQVGDGRMRALLNFPASACGYRLTRVPANGVVSNGATNHK